MPPAKNTGDKIATEYIDELRRRVNEGPGVLAVAARAGLGHTTIWRMLSGGGDRRGSVTIAAIDKIRIALGELAPELAMPPPVVGVRSAEHYAWIKIADDLTVDELATVAAAPARTLATVRADARKRKAPAAKRRKR